MQLWIQKNQKTLLYVVIGVAIVYFVYTNFLNKKDTEDADSSSSEEEEQYPATGISTYGAIPIGSSSSSNGQTPPENRLVVDGSIVSVNETPDKVVYTYRFSHQGKEFDGTIDLDKSGTTKIEQFLVNDQNGIKVGVIERDNQMVGYLALTRE